MASLSETCRNRINYQSLCLFVSQVDACVTPQTPENICALSCLQSLDWDFDLPSEDVGCYGRLSTKKVVTEAPTVNLSFSYYNVDLFNENCLGFSFCDDAALTSIITKQTDNRNYYIGLTPDGVDCASAGPAEMAVYAVGNGYVTSWSTEASVGDFPTTTVSVEGLNICGWPDGVAQPLPTIDPLNGTPVDGTFTLPPGTSVVTGQPLVLQQGDIEIEICSGSALFESAECLCIQSYNFDFDLSRSNIDCLGSKFSRAKEIDFPVEVNFSIDINAGDILETGCLADLLCDPCPTGCNIAVNLYEPVCTGDRRIFARYEVRGACLQGQTFSSSFGSNATSTINWSSSISASGDVENGIYMSGVTGYDTNGDPLFCGSTSPFG